MKSILTLTLCLAMSAATALADSQAFRAIIGDAANIERDAAALSRDLKVKAFDVSRVKSDVEALGKDIASLRSDVEALEGNLSSLSPQQQKDWDLIKTKVQLLMVFYDRKADLLQSDPGKNRSMIRAHADGIAKRAKMLQETANRLDR
jgi:hypothetical protein